MVLLKSVLGFTVNILHVLTLLQADSDRISINRFEQYSPSFSGYLKENEKRNRKPVSNSINKSILHLLDIPVLKLQIEPVQRKISYHLSLNVTFA